MTTYLDPYADPNIVHMRLTDMVNIKVECIKFDESIIINPNARSEHRQAYPLAMHTSWMTLT
jgi:hypothetical protein